MSTPSVSIHLIMKYKLAEQICIIFNIIKEEGYFGAVSYNIDSVQPKQRCFTDWKNKYGYCVLLDEIKIQKFSLYQNTQHTTRPRTGRAKRVGYIRTGGGIDE